MVFENVDLKWMRSLLYIIVCFSTARLRSIANYKESIIPRLDTQTHTKSAMLHSTLRKFVTIRNNLG